MKKVLIAGVAAAAVTVALIVPSGAQASSRTCVQLGGGTCSALIAASHPSVGVVRAGANTRGVFRIACTQGSHAFVRTGFVPLGGAKIIPIPLNGDCVLQGTFRSRTHTFGAVALR